MVTVPQILAVSGTVTSECILAGQAVIEGSKRLSTMPGTFDFSGTVEPYRAAAIHSGTVRYTDEPCRAARETARHGPPLVRRRTT